jgi:hypothetical protein
LTKAAPASYRRGGSVKILFAGIIARHPFGGVTWCSLMYLLGLRALGHEVFYIEDTGECVYDPVLDTQSKDPAYGTAYIQAALEPFGLGDRWSFVNFDGSYHGQSAEHVRRYCADADLFLNLSGGSWFWRDEYSRIPHKAFIDSDPAFTQLSIAEGSAWYAQFFQGFDRLFTFGANIGTAASAVPTGPLVWHKTWQPVTVGDWRSEATPDDRFTTVMSWHIASFANVGGHKDEEFLKYLDLPSRTPQRFRLAINGPRDLLGEHGWETVDAMAASRTPWEYRDFIHRSKAEFSVAKHTYVATHSGWFSDRTECYLASGRPALVQDTGWSEHLPSGEGLLAFSGLDAVLAGIDRINSDYRRHARRAREIAGEYFDARVVLPRLLETACE